MLSTNISLGAEMQIIAHRGSSYTAPENTVSAYKLAWEQKTDAGECDIYLTTDKRIVVCHDKSTSRTTGGSSDLKIPKCSSEELRKLDFGNWKDPKYAGEKIPFLEEVLATIPEGKRLFIEIKCGPEILPALKDTLTKYGKPERIVIIGFDLKTVTESKKAMPQYPTYWLCSTVKDKATSKPLSHNPKWIAQAKKAGLDGLDVHNEGVTEEFMKQVRAAGIGLYTWTVDDVTEAKRLAKLGVDGITTNRPDLLLKEVKGR